MIQTINILPSIIQRTVLGVVGPPVRYRTMLLFILCFLGNAIYSQAQVPKPKYFIKDDQVIFEFDIRAYEEGIKDESSIFQDFKEVDLPRLVESGALEEWSYDGWIFRKKEDNVYQFCKNLESFDAELSPHMKYLIDGRFWAQPYSEPLDPIDFDTTELIKISETGNVTFRLAKSNRAKKVILSGTFNQWNEQELRMNKTDTGWELTVQLVPGIYEYKFIVDGNWITDPANSKKVRNNFETFNSILLVGEKVEFYLPHSPGAKRVVLTGSFNNWDQNAILMERYQDGWLCSIELPPGKHFYKYIIDGNWVSDPTNHLMQRDAEGNLNSVLVVQ